MGKYIRFIPTKKRFVNFLSENGEIFLERGEMGMYRLLQLPDVYIYIRQLKQPVQKGCPAAKAAGTKKEKASRATFRREAIPKTNC